MELDLDQARRRAKERLRAARRGEVTLREDREPRLADAQRSVANELGLPSWPALVGARARRPAATARSVPRGSCAEALAGRADRAERAAATPTPALARAGLDVAVVLGDADAVARGAACRPRARARASCRVAGRKPLSCACHSAFLAPDHPRAPGVRRVVELLLDAGADPNETFDNEYGAMPVLYGAAGVARDPAAARLLLDRGANPERRRVRLPRGRGAKSTECLEILLGRGATVREHDALGNADPQAVPASCASCSSAATCAPEDPELRE